jgi:hypothetical protein
MDQYMIQSDPWDAKIIRLNNMLQFLSIFCDILAIFNNDFRDASMLLGACPPTLARGGTRR